MAIFNRRKKTIAELENYYAKKRVNRTVMAWIMALVSLLVTVAVIVSIFFGGRWIYRALRDGKKDTGPTVTTSETASSGVVSENTEDSSADDSSAKGSMTTGGVVTDEAASTDKPSSTKVTVNTEDSNLPDTGPENIAGTLIVTTVAGYLWSLKRQTKSDR